MLALGVDGVVAVVFAVAAVVAAVVPAVAVAATVTVSAAAVVAVIAVNENQRQWMTAAEAQLSRFCYFMFQGSAKVVNDYCCC